MKKMNKKGFTIVELVIVIAVIAVLAAVLIPTFSGVIGNAKDVAAEKNAQSAYETYLVENANKDVVADDFIFDGGEGRVVAIKDGKVVKDNNATVFYQTVEEAQKAQFVKVADDPATTDVDETVLYEAKAYANIAGLHIVG